MKISQNQRKLREIYQELVKQNQELVKQNQGGLEHLISDPKNGKKWMEDVLTMIEQNEQDDSRESRIANMILVKGVNMVIVACDLDTPLFFEELEEESDENLQQHIAILAGAAVALKQVINLFHSDELVRVYSSSNDLLDNILSGEVKGVIVVSEKDPDIGIRILIHDLRNKLMSGEKDYKDYEEAEKEAKNLLRLPCVTLVSQGFFVVDILQEIKKIEGGELSEVLPESDRVTDLEGYIPRLQHRMFCPDKCTKVMIVDDTEVSIAGMEIVLNAWPNLDVQVLIVGRGHPEATEIVPEKIMATNPDILLLDHDMGVHISGKTVFNHLVRLGFKGLCVSTTGGGQPEYIKQHEHHFCAKAEVKNNLATAERFVEFMNQILVKLTG